MKQYLELLTAIKEKGTHKPAAREGMPGTTSLFGYQFRHNLQDGFPLLTTKKMFWKGVVIELLWFLRGDTNIKYLVDNGVNIWNEDAYQYYLKKVKELNLIEPLDLVQFIDNVKAGNKGGTKKLKDTGYIYGDCGYQYGKVWRKWQGYLHTPNVGYISYGSLWFDQIAQVIQSLKKNPESRRHIVTAIDPTNDTNLALYWCHAMFQFNCRPLNDKERLLEAEKRNLIKFHNPNDKQCNWDVTYPNGMNLEVDGGGPFTKMNHWEWNIPLYTLDCHLYQRSADSFLGVPFNIASYALLTHIIAKLCNMIPGELITSYGDVHIYDNHKEQVEEQLKREPMPLPQLELGYFGLDINEVNSWDMSDFKIINYTSYDPIKAELSTGLKK